jgi:hypothetical protein
VKIKIDWVNLAVNVLILYKTLKKQHDSRRKSHLVFCLTAVTNYGKLGK